MQTFKVGLPTNSNLWKSLTMKPPQIMHQLMDRIEDHKRVEDNRNSARGKTKVSTTNRRDSSGGWFSSSWPRREYYNQASHNVVAPQMVNSVFEEPIYQVLDKIKHEPYFKWPNKMGATPLKEIKAYIANIIRTGAIWPRTAELCKPFEINWLKLVNWSNSCNSQIIR